MNGWKTHTEQPTTDKPCLAMGSFLAPVTWDKEAGQWRIEEMNDVKIIVNFWKEDDRSEEAGTKGPN